MKNLTFLLLMAFAFNLTVCAQGNTSTSGTGNTPTGGTMKIIIGNRELTATLVQNSSTEALKELLRASPITINMRDYGNFEKVGSLNANLPQNNEQITTQSGDLILYQGNQFVIYYARNSWSLTRLGRINNVSPDELRNILGEGNVTVVLELIE